MLHLVAAHQAVALNPLSSTSLLASLGALGVFLALFAETGLLIGFFLPGDSLLFTAGFLCAGSSSAKVHLSLPLVLLAAAGGALAGAQTGFVIGRTAGRSLLERTHRGILGRGAERSRISCHATATARPSSLRGSFRSCGPCSIRWPGRSTSRPERSASGRYLAGWPGPSGSP